MGWEASGAAIHHEYNNEADENLVSICCHPDGKRDIPGMIGLSFDT
jgi:hypothetical protein